jgi:hypothetical protein
MNVISRRDAVKGVLAACGGAAAFGSYSWLNAKEPIVQLPAITEQSRRRKAPIAAVAPLVLAEAKWDADDLYDFVSAVPPEGRLSLKKALHLVPETATLGDLKGKGADIHDILAKLDSVYRNVFEYEFSDALTANYHEKVQWAARKIGVDEKKIDDLSSFGLERDILFGLWGQVWDKLNPQQRMTLLGEIEASDNGTITDKAKKAMMGGAAALFALLSTTVYFSGFAFYTTMSETICVAAGFFGVTLPFAAYSGASVVVAFLTGPIGWAIVAMLAVGGFWLLGRGNPDKTIAAIAQLHTLKIAALMADGVPASQLFSH